MAASRRIFDVRLAIGVLLVVCSIGGVFAVVAAARTTTPAVVAARTLVAGEEITPDDLAVVDVVLSDVAADYPVALDEVAGSYATRTVEAGELVPTTVLAPAMDAETTTVVVRSATPVPATLVPGDTVDVWATEIVDGEAQRPHIVVGDATVAAMSRDDGVLADGSVTLELLIPRVAVADTLAAVLTDATVSVVPVGPTR